MNETPHVQVLLATYNGERYLREQIDSVLAQQDVQVSLLARDDGSRDATVNILEAYEAAYPQQFHLLRDGGSTGSAKGNFLRLMQSADADYVAFCDQDDIWLTDKLAASMRVMHTLESSQPAEAPLLVYTDLQVVDESLQPVSESLWRTNNLRDAEHPSLGPLLMENIVTGCTALMNRALLLRMRNMPATAQMHDHWAALLAASMGAMLPLPQAKVLYRQHGANVVGAMQESRSLPGRLLRLISSEGVQARAQQLSSDRAQAADLLRLHGSAMPSTNREIIQAFLRIPELPRLQRLLTIRRYGLWRSDPQRRIAQTIDLLR